MSKKIRQQILDLLADGRARGLHQIQTDLGYRHRFFKSATVLVKMVDLERDGLVRRWRLLSHPPRWVYTLPHGNVPNATFDPLEWKRGLR